MSKGKSTWKYNKLLTARRNYFAPGGDLSMGRVEPLAPKLDIKMPTLSADNAPKIDQSIKDRLNNTGGGFDIGKAAGIAGVASLGTKHILGAINEAKGADISGIKADIKSQQMGPTMGSDSLNSITTDWNNLSLGKTYSGSDLGKKSTGNIIGGALSQGAEGVAAGAALGPIGMILGGIGGATTSFLGSILGNKKRDKQANQLSELQATVDDFNVRSLQERTDNALYNTFRALDRNYVNSAAFGGPMDFGGGAIDFDFMNRYIMSKEMAAQGKDKSLTSMPNSFAHGGSTHGTDFTNGLLAINNGGSHEENPFEGVPMGVDQEGTPNLVEEGETIFNDYVFSRRLKVPKAIRSKYKLGGPISFADASKKLAKESEERPNDPISENGLVAIMNDLAMTQEALKAEKQNNQFANGGNVNKFDGESTATQNLTTGGNYDMKALLAALGMYKYSQTKGNNPGKYAIDRSIPMKDNPFMLGALDMAALEGSPEYQAFTQYILDNPNMDYFKALDAGVAEGVPRLIGTDGKLVNGWQDLFKHRRTDSNGGIYHFTPWLMSQPQVVQGAIKEEVAKEENKPTDTPVEKAKPTYKPEYLYLGRNKLEPLRFAPALEFGIGALTDALGLTNKPDYSAADAVMNAAKNSIYRPVSFDPLGDYLAYRPQDVNRIANSLSAQAAATRAGIESLTGGNSGARAGQMLAADYNAQRQTGQAIMSATDANLAQEAQRAEFNRGTNMTNRQGFLQADTANQKALAEAGEFGMKGIMAGAQMGEAARRSADAAKSANLSGLFQTLGDIGFEAKNDNMVRRAIEAGIFAPGAQRVYMGAKGGKLKRRKKGLTF